MEAHEVRGPDGVPAPAADRYRPQDRTPGDSEGVSHAVHERAESYGQAYPQVVLSGLGEQPAPAHARVGEHTGEEPGARRAEQPHQEVVVSPDLPPQQAVDR